MLNFLRLVILLLGASGSVHSANSCMEHYKNYNTHSKTRPKVIGWKALELVSQFSRKDGISDFIYFEVPEGTKTIQIEIYPETDNLYPLVSELQRMNNDKDKVVANLISSEIPNNIDGNSIRSAQSFGFLVGPYFSPNRSVGVTPNYGSVVVPNNQNIKLEPGTYRMKVQHRAKEASNPNFKIRILIQEYSPLKTKKILPLHFRFAGTDGLNSKMLKNNEAFKQMIEELKTIFSNSDIEIKIASEADLKASTNDKNTSEINVFDEYKTLFSSEPVENGIKLYLLNPLPSLLPGDAGGYSYGIGGPVMSKNYHTGGIVITAQYLEYPKIMATIIAHELGHYLGLFHVKEPSLLLFDQILDTNPEIEGPSNIMTAGNPNDPTTLRFFSKEQGELIINHPAIEKTVED
jgi:hypothetical protein